MRHCLCFALALLLAGTGAAEAQMSLLPEIRGGLYAHDVESVDQAWSVFDAESVRDANVELLFEVPELSAWSFVGEFRPNVGATINFEGGQSMAYAGLAWTFQAPILPVFVEASAGAAVLGRLDGTEAQAGDIGCPAAFHGSLSAGVLVFPGISTMLTAEHANDFGLCGTESEGITNIGLRLGVRF